MFDSANIRGYDRPDNRDLLRFCVLSRRYRQCELHVWTVLRWFSVRSNWPVECHDPLHGCRGVPDICMAIYENRGYAPWSYSRIWVRKYSTYPALITDLLARSFSSGAYVSLLSNPLMEMGETLSDIGTRIGMFTTIMAVGALAGPPISGAIADRTSGFGTVGCYAGTTVLAGVTLMCVARYLVLKPGSWRA